MRLKHERVVGNLAKSLEERHSTEPKESWDNVQQ